MFDPTHARGEVQPPLFELTRSATDAPEALARWVYPCGLCGTVEVTDDGGLCTSCSPAPVRKPNRTRKTTKTAKTTTTKAAAKAGNGRARRAQPDRGSTKPVRAAGESGGGR